MSGGLFALLDDVAVLARMAAASIDDVAAAAGKATVKSAGVVIDDTAVTPQYVHGIAAERELPMIKRIAMGSVRNKLLIILPAALILNAFLPGLLPIILILGGGFLAFEGAHKVWHHFLPHDEHHEEAATELGPDAERQMVAGAVRTDLILSAEIMVIALASVASESIWTQLGVLIVVALVITVAVYGVVALIVKMDDVGLSLAQRTPQLAKRVGLALVAGMPKLLTGLSVVGTVAMLWVGGHIMLANVHEAGWWDAPYDLVHDLEHEIEHAVHGGFGAVLGWLANTAVSAVVGFVVGSVIAGLVSLWPSKEKPAAGPATRAAAH
ncbi:DUF808 domain-containing protein [Nocardioides dubius]|uniref:DUF808 domain-containing protein n=1 Tax=Nocardioides dubius TaxID=317019 RepID=A0ABP4EFH0_9ACTN